METKATRKIQVLGNGEILWEVLPDEQTKVLELKQCGPFMKSQKLENHVQGAKEYNRGTGGSDNGFLAVFLAGVSRQY